MPKGKVVSMGFLPLIHPPWNFVGYHGFLSLTKVLSVTEKCNKQRACGVMHWRRNLDKTAAFLLLKVLKFQVKRVFGPVLNVKCKTGLASDQNIWQSLFYDQFNIQYPTISYHQVHPQQASFLQSSTLWVPTGYCQATPWSKTKLIDVPLPTLQFLWMRCCHYKKM